MATRSAERSAERLSKMRARDKKSFPSIFSAAPNFFLRLRKKMRSPVSRIFRGFGSSLIFWGSGLIFLGRA
jgi:hypothetical protein